MHEVICYVDNIYSHSDVFTWRIPEVILLNCDDPTGRNLKLSDMSGDSRLHEGSRNDVSPG